VPLICAVEKPEAAADTWIDAGQGTDARAAAAPTALASCIGFNTLSYTGGGNSGYRPSDKQLTASSNLIVIAMSFGAGIMA
jgi:hypothetical protein